jgi:16S rRNA processing protein RimM
VTLARVLKTQGRHGEVAAELHSDVPDRFVEGLRLYALNENGTRRELVLENIWPHKGRAVLKFAGIDSIDDAETLLRCELQVPRSERAQLEAGWLFVSDLVGCTVFDGDREIGTIRDVRFGAGEAPLLVVADEVAAPEKRSGRAVGATKEQRGTEYEIPFAEAYLKKVDAAARQVHMQLPEGMLEINAPLSAEEKEAQSKREE